MLVVSKYDSLTCRVIATCRLPCTLLYTSEIRHIHDWGIGEAGRVALLILN